MIKEAERIDALSHADEIALDLVNSSTRTKTFIKEMSNFCNTVIPGCIDADLEKGMFSDIEATKSLLKKMYSSIVEFNEHKAMPVDYSTGELSKFFGVSITSINKWVEDGRFKGVKRLGRNKQLRITENTLWRDSRGNYLPIKTIVKEYELQKKKDEQFTEDDEKKALLNMIKHYEKKYNGTYEKTLKDKANKNSQELRDEDEWVYLLERIKNN